MVSLFELGSVHHGRYLVNLQLHFMPLADHVHEFRGLSQLSEIMVLVSMGGGRGGEGLFSSYNGFSKWTFTMLFCGFIG